MIVAHIPFVYIFLCSLNQRRGQLARHEIIRRIYSRRRVFEALWWENCSHTISLAPSLLVYTKTPEIMGLWICKCVFRVMRRCRRLILMLILTREAAWTLSSVNSALLCTSLSSWCSIAWWLCRLNSSPPETRNHFTSTLVSTIGCSRRGDKFVCRNIQFCQAEFKDTIQLNMKQVSTYIFYNKRWVCIDQVNIELKIRLLFFK